MPSSNPPSGNIAAPVNTSNISQIKNGALGVLGLNAATALDSNGNTIGGIIRAENQMRANQYCDVSGGNCVAVTEMTSAPSCSLQLTTIRGTTCFTMPSCPAGSVKVDTRTAPMNWCPGDGADYTYHVDCVSLACN